MWANSWPNGVLEVSGDHLILRDEMIKKEFSFSKSQVSKIAVKKVFPLIGYGIRIYHNNESYDKRLYFWYWSVRFDKLLGALKECGWLAESAR